MAVSDCLANAQGAPVSQYGNAQMCGHKGMRYGVILTNDFINLTTSNRKVFYFITRLLRLYYAILRQPSISAFCCFGIQLCIKHAGETLYYAFITPRRSSGRTIFLDFGADGCYYAFITPILRFITPAKSFQQNLAGVIKL